MDRIAAIIEETIPVNFIVLAEGEAGNDYLKAHPEAVDVTGMNPMPSLDSGWTYVNGKWVAPVSAPPTLAEVELARALAYRETSDPIFFQYQRGDKTEAEWLSAVEAVKAAHPYPEA